MEKAQIGPIKAVYGGLLKLKESIVKIAQRTKRVREPKGSENQKGQYRLKNSMSGLGRNRPLKQSKLNSIFISQERSLVGQNRSYVQCMEPSKEILNLFYSIAIIYNSKSYNT